MKLAQRIISEASPSATKLASEIAASMFTKGRVQRHMTQAKLQALILAALWRHERNLRGED